MQSDSSVTKQKPIWYTSIIDTLKPYLDTWEDDFKKDKVGYSMVDGEYFEKHNGEINCGSIRPEKIILQERNS